jgi:hypothetical protein
MSLKLCMGTQGELAPLPASVGGLGLGQRLNQLSLRPCPLLTHLSSFIFFTDQWGGMI